MYPFNHFAQHFLNTSIYKVHNKVQNKTVGCEFPLTVQHIMIDCINFAHIYTKDFLGERGSMSEA